MYPPTAKWPSALGARSPMKPSKFEWATLPLNSRTFVRRGQVADVLVAGLDAVFEEEAVTDGVVGHVVLNLQIVRAMHGHAAVVGVVDRGVPDVLPLRVADQMPVDRIPGQRQVLAHAIELDAFDKHLAGAHRHHVPAVE